MADDEQHLDLFRCRCEWANSSVPAMTSRDHERLHAHREILRQAS